MRRNPLSRLAAPALALAITATGAVGSAPAWAEPTNGTISGRFVDRDGTGLRDYDVQFRPVEGGGGSSGWTRTDWDGRFSADVAPGSYLIAFLGPPGSAGFFQFVPGTDVAEEASAFEVADGQTIEVNDTIYPTGTITGRFTDADRAGHLGPEHDL